MRTPGQTVVLGMFRDRAAAQDSIAALRDAGFAADSVGVLMRHPDETYAMTRGTEGDLGVGGSPTIKTPSTDRDKASKKTETTGDTSSGTVTPSTPPATGGTGGTTATPVAPTQPQGDGGGVGQAPTQPAPAQPEGEGGGAAAPPGN